MILNDDAGPTTKGRIEATIAVVSNDHGVVLPVPPTTTILPSA